VQDDPNSPDPIVYVAKADPVPPEMLCVVGDAIHNLRSALDHLACALIYVNGSKPSPKVEFPILDGPITTAKREARFAGKVEGMRKEVIDAIRDIKPYQGGNDALWRVHRLDVIDKHDVLIGGIGNITAVNSLSMGHWEGNRWLNFSKVPAVLEQGNKFKFVGANVCKDTPFVAEVVFNEPDVAEGYPVIFGLAQFRTAVMKVISDLSWALF
jgi:hypothetical protein